MPIERESVARAAAWELVADACERGLALERLDPADADQLRQLLAAANPLAHRSSLRMVG